MTTIEQLRLELDTSQAQQDARKFEIAITATLKGLEGLDRRIDEIEKGTRQTGLSFGLLSRELVKQRQAVGHQVAAFLALNKRLEGVEAAGHATAAALAKVGRSGVDSARGLNASTMAARRSVDSYDRMRGALLRITGLFGAGLGIRSAVTAIGTFDLEMKRVEATTGASAQEMARLRDAAKDLGASTEFTATQAANAQLQLSRAGFTTQETLASLRASLDLATVGQIGMAKAADYTSNTMRQFGLVAAEATRITDSFVTVSNRANTDIPQLAEAFKFAGSVAGSLGVSLEQTAAMVGALSDRGLKASQAGTAIRGLLVTLSDLTPEARDALEAANVSLDRLDLRSNNVIDVLDELGLALRNGANFSQIFTRYTLAGALGLAQSTDKIRDLVKQQDEANDASARAGATIRDSLVGAYRELASSIEAATLKAGDEGFAGSLQTVTRFTTETVRKLVGLKNEVDRFGTGTDIAAAAVENLALAMAAASAVRLSKWLYESIPLLATYTASVRGAATATTAMNVASTANPIALIVASLAGGKVAFDAWQNSLRRAAQSTEELTAKTRDYLQTQQSVIAILRQGGSPRVVDNTVEQQLARAQRNAEAMRTEFVKLDKLEVEPEFRFDNVEEASATILRWQERLVAARKQQEEIRDGVGVADPTLEFFVDSNRIAKLDGEIATLADKLKKVHEVGIAIGGVEFVSGSNIIQLGRFKQEVEDLAELLERGKAGSGIFGLFRKDDAARVAQREHEEAKKRADEIKNLRDRNEAAVSAPQLLNADLADIDKRIATLAKEREVLDRVKDGELTLDDARRQIEQRRDADAKIEEFRQNLQEKSHKLSDTEEQRAREKIAALHAQEAALEDYAASLDGSGRIEKTATDRAREFVDALRNKAEAMRDGVSVTITEDEVMRRLRAILPETAEGYAKLAAEARGWAAAARETVERRDLEQQLERDARAAQRAQEQLEDLVRSMRFEREAIILTQEAVDELALRERVRQIGFDKDVEDRLAAYQRETNALISLREQMDIVAGGAGDVLRALKEGESTKDALARGYQSVIDGTFEKSVAAFQEQLGAGLTGIFAPILGIATGADAPVPGATPGENGIIAAVKRVEAAVRATALGRGGGDGGFVKDLIKAQGSDDIGNARWLRNGANDRGGFAGGAADVGQFMRDGERAGAYIGGPNEEFQNALLSGGSKFDWGNFAGSAAIGLITLGLSRALNRDRDREQPSDGRFGFDPVSRGGSTVVNNNQRVTIQAAPNPRALRRTVHQVATRQNSRWGDR